MRKYIVYHELANSQTRELSRTHEHTHTLSWTHVFIFSFYHPAVGVSPIVVNISHWSTSPFFVHSFPHIYCMGGLHGRIDGRDWWDYNICAALPRHTLREVGPAHNILTVHLMALFSDFLPVHQWPFLHLGNHWLGCKHPSNAPFYLYTPWGVCWYYNRSHKNYAKLMWPSWYYQKTRS